MLTVTYSQLSQVNLKLKVLIPDETINKMTTALQTV